MGCSGMCKRTKIDPVDGKLKKKTAAEVLENTPLGKKTSGGKSAKDKAESLVEKIKPKKEHKTGW